MPDLLTIDLANILLFTMPGFFFLRALGYKSNSDLAYFVYSMFWGILLMIFMYKLVLPINRLSELVDNPYAGAVILSILAMMIGFGLRLLRPKFLNKF